MKKYKILAFVFLLLSYTSLSLVFVFDNHDQENPWPFCIAWILGILSFIFNTIVGEKNLNRWVFVLQIITGIMWLIPFLLITYFGIPCLIIYFFIGIYLQKDLFQRLYKSK
jgi:hypothetical protein